MKTIGDVLINIALLAALIYILGVMPFVLGSQYRPAPVKFKPAVSCDAALQPWEYRTDWVSTDSQATPCRSI